MLVKYLIRYIDYYISSRYYLYKQYFLNKKKYHGKLKFTHTNHIGDNSSFEGANSMGKDSVFIGSMGFGTYIGKFCELTASIGRFTSIASEVASNPGIHPMTYPYATTSPMFYSTQNVNGESFVHEQLFKEYKEPVTIGNDCWIGQKVYINAGITIGDGAVVYAGSVVTKDVPPYAVVAGVPAKILKYRYSEEDIAFLLDVKWWEKPIDWLAKNYLLLCDINRLKKEFQST